MSVNKRYLKTRRVCKVTFKLPKEAVPAALKVSLVGDFNQWDARATPMKRMKSGGFSTTLDLESGSQYQFRYLIDNEVWENDWSADAYVPNPYGNGENSVVQV